MAVHSQRRRHQVVAVGVILASACVLLAFSRSSESERNRSHVRALVSKERGEKNDLKHVSDHEEQKEEQIVRKEPKKERNEAKDEHNEEKKEEKSERTEEGNEEEHEEDANKLVQGEKKEFVETWKEAERDCKKECESEDDPTKCEKTCMDEEYWIQPHECVDHQRIKGLSWTNETCVRADMLLNQSSAEFYVMCGVEATLMKVKQYKPIDRVVSLLLKLMFLSAICALIPMVLSSLVFQSVSGKKKTDEPDYEPVAGQPPEEGCFSKCKKKVGSGGYYAFLLAIIASNIYTTAVTTRRVFSETAELRSTLHYGGWCNFSLYMDYTCHGEILEVLTLAMFTWSDLIFMVGKLMHDAGLGCAAFCCTQWECLKCFCCCRWLVFCSCATLCKVLLFLVCFIPFAIVLFATFVIPGLYAFLCLGLVGLCYGIVTCIVLSFVLALVYMLSLMPMSIMKCFYGIPIQTPGEYFALSLERLCKEIDSNDEPDSAIKFLMSKRWVITIPILCFYGAEIMDMLNTSFMTPLALSEGNYQKVLDLQDRVAQQNIFAQLWNVLIMLLTATNDFVYDYLVAVPMQVVPLYEDMKKYLDWKVMLAEIASLADLGIKFKQFKTAVCALRVGGGLLVGPMRLFETLAKFDK